LKGAKSFPINFTIDVTAQNEEFLQEAAASSLFSDFTDKTGTTHKIHE